MSESLGKMFEMMAHNSGPDATDNMSNKSNFLSSGNGHVNLPPSHPEFYLLYSTALR